MLYKECSLQNVADSCLIVFMTFMLSRSKEPISFDRSQISTRYTCVHKGDLFSVVSRPEPVKVPKFKTLQDQQVSYINIFYQILSNSNGFFHALGILDICAHNQFYRPIGTWWIIRPVLYQPHSLSQDIIPGTSCRLH